jgi:hypothetical protein
MMQDSRFDTGMPFSRTLTTLRLGLLVVSLSLLSACASGPEPIQLIDERFHVVSDKEGVIQDMEGGLQWMRCSLGQQWTGTNCVGEAVLFTWADAGNRAIGLEYAGHTDWRLPTVEELYSLVYCSNGQKKAFHRESLGMCSGQGFTRPTINLEAFPGTASATFWSGSAAAGFSNSAWFVSFDNGNASRGIRSVASHVRLVRSVR